MDEISKLANTVIEFAVAYGFRILGAIIVLLIGLKLAALAGGWVRRVAVRRNIDMTLAKFFANVAKLLLVGLVIVITLAHFGVTIAPIIALAGASAFGVTLALQGPLSNYGAGLAIILTRPFIVGNTIRVRGAEGVVDDIGLGATVLLGEDGERITIPNKEIVGAILVNSQGHRIVETRLFLDAEQDVERAIVETRAAIAGAGLDATAPAPQVGVEDFEVGGVVVGARYWVPSLHYFQRRYAINGAILRAIEAAGIHLRPPAGAGFVPLTRRAPAAQFGGASEASPI